MFAAVNAATALRHAMEHAAAAQTRIAEQLAKLEVESGDLRHRSGARRARSAAAGEATRGAREAMDVLRVERAAASPSSPAHAPSATRDGARAPRAASTISPASRPG